MVLPSVGTTGRGTMLAPTSASPAGSAINRSESVTLDPSALCTFSDFSATTLGTPRQVGAAMARVESHVTIELEECQATLGETDRRVVEQVERYIEHGVLPENPPDELMFAQITGLLAGDTGQTRESRLQIMLQAGMEWLEAAKGPGLNLLNVAGRTGLIVALTVVLRQVVAYHVEQALREGDSREAGRAWAVVAITMIGPALTLIGAIRNECDGTASLSSRLGRVCMASVTMGALIAAHLTASTEKLLPAVVGGSIYTVARGLANVFIPLKDNAGSSNAATTGAATAAYGVAQFFLAELGQLTPLSGAARAAAELGYSLGADAIQGVLNGFGIVVDDVISILCKCSHVLSPNPGLDSVFSDPEALSLGGLEVRMDVQLPTRTQFADALLDIGALRLSAGHAIALVIGAVASLLSSSEIDDGDQGYVMSGCLGLMAMIIYFPLVFGSAKRTDNLYMVNETAIP